MPRKEASPKPPAMHESSLLDNMDKIYKIFIDKTGV